MKAWWLAPLFALASVSPAQRQNAVQSCTTRCQERYTNCVLGCDGDAACARGCVDQVAQCVRACGQPKAASR